MIEETPFLQNSVNDTIVRGTVLQGESNFRQYNRVKKDTITKFALMHGIGAAEDLSRLTRGLTRRTILKSCTTDTQVLSWIDPDNTRAHLLIAKGSISHSYSYDSFQFVHEIASTFSSCFMCQLYLL